MALSNSSTLSDALAQYDDNMSWEGDASKAVLFLAAIRWLLVHRPQTNSIQGRTIGYNALESQKAEVAAYVATHGANVNRASFVRARMSV